MYKQDTKVKPTELKQRLAHGLNIKILAFTFFLLLPTIYCFAQVPSPNFTSNITSGCSPIIVNFTDQSTGNPTSWLWDFGNGGTSTLKNPSTTYFTPGTYTVTLIATNINGSDTITKTDYLIVYDEPVANFGSNKTGGCFPAIINFFDQSTTPPNTQIVSWNWDFGDGAKSTERNPQHVYRATGIYTVILRIVNDKGCEKVITKPNYIDVTKGVVPKFRFSDPSSCSAPASVTFTNTSTGPPNLKYTWSFGDGQTSNAINPTNLYAVNGTYSVRLIVESDQGCVDTTTVNMDIGKVVTDFIVPDKICPNTSVEFLNNSTPRPIKARWEFSDGKFDTLRNGTNSFANPGNYTVTLINTYGVCKDTLVKPITVQPRPVVNFSTNDTASCKFPFTSKFSNSSNATSYSWNFGDGGTSTDANPNYTYNNYGNYNVTLIAKSDGGCVDSLTKPAYVKIQKPVISFKDLPAKGCIPYPITFSANIQTLDVVTSYNWDFGDGVGKSTLEKPSYVYTALGTYNVTLTITTSTGCTETFTLPEAVKVGTKPSANFVADKFDVCASETVKFTNLSPMPTDEWLWDFGEGGTSTQENPSYTFSDTGFLDIRLIVFNNGCSDTLTKKNYIHIKPPVAKFEYRPDCNNKLVYTFTDKSLGAKTWSWNFGDGTTATGVNPPPHTYASLGTYKVTLTTTNAGCSSTISRNIIIADQTPDFTTSSAEGCRPAPFTFTAKPPNPGLVKTYTWNFGDGSPAGSGATVSHSYLNTGFYNIQLTTVDTFGCTYTAKKDSFIRVNGPIAKFSSTTNSGCKGLIATFNDSTITTGDNPIVNWTFDFGDGVRQSFTAPPFQHQYDSVGDYNVKMVVTDSRGCSDSVSYREFVIISTLKAGFTTSGQTCPGAPLGFTNQTISDLPYTSVWNFGDSLSATVTNPSHAFADTGFYTVQLIVKDLFGCEDSITIPNIVRVGLPEASFTANALKTYCIPFEAKFTNTSTYYQSSVWDLAPGISTQQNPSTYYTSKGVYPIKLTVTSPGGCKDTAMQTLTVFTPEDGTITYSPLEGCTPVKVSFDAFSEMDARFIWDFGDGNVSDTTVNVIDHTYRDFGRFVPKVILIEPTGSCTVPLTGTKPIFLLGVKAKYTLDNYFFCDSGKVTVLDSTTSNDPIRNYEWDFGDGTTYSSTAPTHTYTKPGLYNVSLVVNTEIGCTDTLIKGPIKVVESPLISVNYDTVICALDRISHMGIFDRPDTSLVRWTWTFPNGNSSQDQNPVLQQYKTPGNYTVTTIATNTSGCADTVVKSLLVHALPSITVPPVLTKIVGIPIVIPATYSSGVRSYLWSPAESLSCPDCPQPTSTTKFTTKYTISVIDSNSCTVSENVQVIVLCKGATIFLPNTFSPNGDGSNDIFYPRGTGLDRAKSLRVFNRWGEVVFEQRDFPVNNAMYGWDGKYKGNKPHPDVYVYQVEIYCENGEIVRFEGNVALIQ